MKNTSILLIILAGMFAIIQACRKDPGISNTPPGATPYPMASLKIPKYFPPLNIPYDNPETVEGVQLGRMLFYDPILSSDSTKSCFSCHIQNGATPLTGYSFTDHHTQFSTGVTGIVGTRNAPALINLGFRSDNGFFWDGRAASMEDQAVQPVINPIELHENWDHVVQKLQRSSFYPALFKKAFGSSVITQDNAVKAIAQFERILISDKSPFDKYLATGRNQYALNDSAYQGYLIFANDPIINPVTLSQSSGPGTQEGADCFHCHLDPLFQNIANGVLGAYRNNGLDSVASIYDFPDPGYGKITGDTADYGKFRIPTLRNIALTAPYMHDGRFTTLEQVIDHYDHGTKPSPTVDAFMSVVLRRGLGGKMYLTPVEKRQMIAFLNSLTDTSFINNPAYSNPFTK